jgi:hypothetical protein
MQKHLKLVAAAGAAAAIAVPSASAYYPDYGRQAVPRTVVIRQVVAQSDGFNWSDAAIGAAAGFGATLVLAGSTLAVRRARGSEALA